MTKNKTAKNVAFGPVPTVLHKKFKKAAKQNGKTTAEAIIEAMNNYLNTIQGIQEKNLNDVIQIGEFLKIHQSLINGHKQQIDGHENTLLWLCGIIGEVLKLEQFKELKKKVDKQLNANLKKAEEAGRAASVN